MLYSHKYSIYYTLMHSGYILIHNISICTSKDSLHSIWIYYGEHVFYSQTLYLYIICIHIIYDIPFYYNVLYDIYI